MLASATNASGLVTEYAYDTMDRVTNISWCTSGGASLGGFAYEYDAVGRIVSRSHALGSKGSATVNFRLNFRALSKCVKFHPCAVAQGRDGKSIYKRVLLKPKSSARTTCTSCMYFTMLCVIPIELHVAHDTGLSCGSGTGVLMARHSMGVQTIPNAMGQSM